MTNVELYDLALAGRVSEPAVFRLGDRCVLGLWMSADDAAKRDPKRILYQSSTRAIFILAEGKEWEDCAAAMGWIEAVTGVRPTTPLEFQNVPGRTPVRLVKKETE